MLKGRFLNDIVAILGIVASLERFERSTRCLEGGHIIGSLFLPDLASELL